MLNKHFINENFFRHYPQQQDKNGQTTLCRKDQKKAFNEKKYILCRNCLNILTLPSENILIDGAHTHTFANPAGIVYEIRCFNLAGGCIKAGNPSFEFAWFKGYFWKIANCAKCLSHKGWFFQSSTGSSFYGLIIDNYLET